MIIPVLSAPAPTAPQDCVTPHHGAPVCGPAAGCACWGLHLTRRSPRRPMGRLLRRVWSSPHTLLPLLQKGLPSTPTLTGMIGRRPDPCATMARTADARTGREAGCPTGPPFPPLLPAGAGRCGKHPRTQRAADGGGTAWHLTVMGVREDAQHHPSAPPRTLWGQAARTTRLVASAGVQEAGGGHVMGRLWTTIRSDRWSNGRRG